MSAGEEEDVRGYPSRSAGLQQKKSSAFIPPSPSTKELIGWNLSLNTDRAVLVVSLLLFTSMVAILPFLWIMKPTSSFPSLQ